MNRKPVRKLYGYGIVGKSGKPFLGKSCVCDERAWLQPTVERLNANVIDSPYRVVRLFYMSRK